MKSNLRVVVLFGGDSNEREISLESGRNVCYKLTSAGYTVVPVFVNAQMAQFQITSALLIRNRTAEIAELVTESMKIGWSSLNQICDFVFIALHGGRGENGAVQGALEMLNIPYNGSGVLASALCMNKHRAAQFLKSEGFDTPTQKIVSRVEWQSDHESVITALKAGLTLPLITKPNNDGCSMLVSCANSWQDVASQLDTLFAQGKQEALIEERLMGMELTVGVIGNEKPFVLPPSHTVSTGDILSIEEKFLPGQGENRTPAPLSHESIRFVQETIGRAYGILGLAGYARIDCFYQKAQETHTNTERLVILEVNTLPGLTPSTCLFHQAAEVDMRPIDLLDAIIKYGLELHAYMQPKQRDVLVGEAKIETMALGQSRF